VNTSKKLEASVGCATVFLFCSPADMKVSIIIPTYNRAKALQRALTSVRNLHGLTAAEVIVADNGSSDNTPEVCRQFISQGLSLRYISETEPGLLSVRHAGASAATGDVLCFLDDDVELDEGWLVAVQDVFKDDKVHLVTGPSLPRYEVPPPNWIDHLWSHAYNGKVLSWLSLLDLGDRRMEIDPLYVFGLNFSIRRSSFIELEGFHPDSAPHAYREYQGDGETGLTLKARKNGYKAIYDPRMKLYHCISAKRMTAEYFCARAFFQGICNSFTTLRDPHAFGENKSLLRKLYRLVKWPLSELKLTITQPSDVRMIINLMNQKEREGFAFHRDGYNKEEKIRDWVHRTNYWDYKLPK
jgi:glucosyl-dolichyl phosphate glucuronosyltransferase